MVLLCKLKCLQAAAGKPCKSGQWKAVVAKPACAFAPGPAVPSGENDMALRGDIHVLIVGDPGLGKSQLLQARKGRR